MIIQPVVAADIPDVLTFVLQARAELFPKLSRAGTPADLADFEAVYLQADGQFLVAREAASGLVFQTSTAAHSSKSALMTSNGVLHKCGGRLARDADDAV